MDQNESPLSPEQEVSSPSPRTELNEPLPQAELPSLPRPAEEYFVERRGSAEDGGEKKKSTARRLIRYVAATAAAVGLLAEAAPVPESEPPREYVDAPSRLVIECAAVLPDEPEILRFSDYSRDPLLGKSDWDFFYYIVGSDGTETELVRYGSGPDTAYSRRCFMREDLPSEDNRVYKLFSYDEDVSSFLGSADWASYGNIGFHMNRIPVGELPEGASLKLVETYRMGEVWYRSSTARKIDLLPPEPEISVSLETEALGDGMSQAHFRAVVHPREGDDHVYFFGTLDQLLDEHWDYYAPLQESEGVWDSSALIDPIPSFCVRWYDADRNFLHEGWEHVAPFSVQPWPFPSVSREGRDFVMEYDGPVQSGSPNEDAVYYSLELTLVDVSTGWRYLIETGQVPVTD